MHKYHKINSIFKRDPETHKFTKEFSTPEFEYLQRNTWVLSEKIDGMNIRVHWDGEGVIFGGRTDRAELPAPLLARLEERFCTTAQTEKLRSISPDGDMTLYGEGYGPKIQKGGCYRADQDIIIFDIRIGDWWMKRDALEEIAKELSLDVVPIIGEGDLHYAISGARYGIQSSFGKFEAEGVVARPKVELKARSGQRVITKIKCRDFK